MADIITPNINYPVIIVACTFMLLDIISGFTAAIVNKCVDSSKMKEGLLHKCGFILAICLGCLCDYSMLYIDMGFNIPIQESVCLYIILTELMSNLENLGKISPDLSNSKFMTIFRTKKGDEE